MNFALIADRCQQLGFDPHELARRATVDPFFLIDHSGFRDLDALPIGILTFLCRSLGINFSDLVYPWNPQPQKLGDDLRLEAALWMAGTLGRDDIAHIFGWTLGRTERALSFLEGRLRRAGTRLYLVDAHRYRLGPAASALSRTDQQRIRRLECDRDRLGIEKAGVLCLIVDGWQDKAIWSHPPSRAIVERLIEAGLVVNGGSRVCESSEVEFSLGLRDRR